MRINILRVLALTLAAALTLTLTLIYTQPSALHPDRHPEPETVRTIDSNVPDSHLTPLVVSSDDPGLVSEWEKRLREIDIELDSDVLEELTATVPDSQLRSAIDQLAARSDESGRLLGQLLLRRWAASAPAEAAQWIAHLPDNDFGHMAFREIVTSRADADLAGTVIWVQQLPDNGNKTVALLSLAQEAAIRKETATAIALVADFPPGPERDALLDYSVLQWATTDADGAVAWTKQVPDAAMRDEMLANIAVGLGVQEPFRAAGLIAASMNEDDHWHNALINVVRFWTVSSPEQAAAWVDQFPAGRLRSEAMENILDVIARADPGSASFQ